VEYLVKGIESGGLTDAERKLIIEYRKLKSADKENVLLAINAWAGKK
jgi:hypothetical protein